MMRPGFEKGVQAGLPSITSNPRWKNPLHQSPPRAETKHVVTELGNLHIFRDSYGSGMGIIYGYRGPIIGGSLKIPLIHNLGNLSCRSMPLFQPFIGWQVRVMVQCISTVSLPIPSPWKMVPAGSPTAITHEKKGKWSVTKPPGNYVQNVNLQGCN